MSSRRLKARKPRKVAIQAITESPSLDGMLRDPADAPDKLKALDSQLVSHMQCIQNTEEAPSTSAIAAISNDTLQKRQREAELDELSKCATAMNEVFDERDLKRIRRKQKNRESAQRSRQRKADETQGLANAVRLRDAELAEWRAVCSTLQANLQQLAMQVTSLGGHVDGALLRVQLPGMAKLPTLAASSPPNATPGSSDVQVAAAAASTGVLPSASSEMPGMHAHQALVAAIAEALSTAQG
jgi:hypothetical protein